MAFMRLFLFFCFFIASVSLNAQKLALYKRVSILCTALKLPKSINKKVCSIIIQKKSLDLRQILKNKPNQKEIWNALFGLEELETLYLQGNDLTKIPPAIKKLTALKRLDLSNNNLTRIPNEVILLPKLEELEIANNKINLEYFTSTLFPMREEAQLNPLTIGIYGNPIADETRRMDLYAKQIMTPAHTISVPEPSFLNEGLKDAKLMITCAQWEKKHGSLNEELQSALSKYVTDAIEKTYLQGADEKLSIPLPLEKMYQERNNHFYTKLSDATMMFIKLCYYSDLARVPLERREDFEKFIFTRGSYRLELLLTSKSREFFYLKGLSIEDFLHETCSLLTELNTLPIIPIYLDNGKFGENTFLFALSHGFLLLPFAINNSSNPHQSSVASFQSNHNYFSLFNENLFEPISDLAFFSSLVLFEHDLFHLQEILFSYANPALKYHVSYLKNKKILPKVSNEQSVIQARFLVNLYRQSFIYLMNSQKGFSNPKVVSLLLYYITHEAPFGFQSKVKSLREWINNTLDYDLELKKLKKYYPKCSIGQINSILIFNKFDIAQSLKDFGCDIELDYEDPKITMDKIKEILLDALDNSGRIQNIFTFICPYSVNPFFGVVLD